MSIATEMQDALAELEADVVNASFIFNGFTWPCIPSSLRRGTVLEVGGFTEEIQLTLFVRKNAASTAGPIIGQIISQTLTVDTDVLTADSTVTVDSSMIEPTSGKKVTHRNRTFRIGRVSQDAPGSHYSLDLIPQHRARV